MLKSYVLQVKIYYWLHPEMVAGKKLPLYPAEEAEVLLLSERVMEAHRLVPHCYPAAS
jgi:hypothetical protein